MARAHDDAGLAKPSGDFGAHSSQVCWVIGVTYIQSNRAEGLSESDASLTTLVRLWNNWPSVGGIGQYFPLWW
jgi:hypothetical protein